MSNYKFISWGGGLQSTAMAAMSVLGDLPKVDAVVHSDPGLEWSKTYETINWYLDWFSGRGMIAESIKLENSIKSDCAMNHIHIPAWTESGAPMRRQCTKNYKLDPLKRRLRELAGYHQAIPPHPKPEEFEVWIGFTLDEQERRSVSRIKYMVNRWPLIELGMTRDDCTKYLLVHGLPIPPKSACIICPYRRAKEWLLIKNETPDEWDEVLRIDRQIRNAKPSDQIEADSLYLWHRSEPLEDIDLETQAEIDRLKAKDREYQIIICDGGSCWT